MLQLLILVGRALAFGLRGHRELVLDRAHQKPLADIKTRILSGLINRIPGFVEAHIHTVGTPSNVDSHHLC